MEANRGGGVRDAVKGRIIIDPKKMD